MEKMNTRSSRINPPVQKRDFQGRFKKTCGSLIHDIVDSNATLKEQIRKIRKLRKKSVVKFKVKRKMFRNWC